MDFEKKTGNYCFLLRDYYEILRTLIDAFLYTERISISNHQCSNAYICKNHPGLGLQWQVLETTRLSRNAVNYEGAMISKETWESVHPKVEQYIIILGIAINKRIGKK
ncbi:hypothetical protein JXB28_01495 [Candidatus Woesearchaeota archaeon]|nr:hypothetical protein [Candidatus Woesearchaeota archaeon]